MEDNLGPELDLGNHWTRLISKFGFIRVAQEYRPESFRDLWVKYESSDMVLAFARDKGLVAALVGPRDKNRSDVSNLDDLTMVLGALGELDPESVPTLEDQASKFNINYSKIVSIYSRQPSAEWTAAMKNFQRRTFAKTAPHLLAALERHDADYGKDGTSFKN